MATISSQKMSSYAVIIAAIVSLVSIFMPWCSTIYQTWVPIQVSTGYIFTMGFLSVFMPGYSNTEKVLLPIGAFTGLILFALATIALIMGLIGTFKPHRAGGVVTLIIGIIFSLVVYMHMPSSNNFLDETITINAGYWLSMASGVLLFITGLWKTATR